MNKNKSNECNNYTNEFIIKFVVSFFIIINFILNWCLIGQFSNNKIMSEYKDNWSMTPIKNIFKINNTHFHFNKKENNLNNIQKRLGYFPGLKKNEDKNLREIKGADITIWGNTQLGIELMDEDFKYYDLLKNDYNKKNCGFDEQGNFLYFPTNKECPINYISILESEIDHGCLNCNKIQLNNGKYLHFSNEKKNKILVQFYIANFCVYFKNCDSENDIKEFNEYEILDNENINELMKENGFLLNNNYYNSINNSISLYYRSFIDIDLQSNLEQTQKIKKYMKYLIKFQNYCKIKNIFFIFFNIIIALFFVLSFFSIYYTSLCYLIILFFVFFRCLLSVITIGYFNQMTKHLFKYTIKLKYYENNDDSKSMRIEGTLFVFDQCIFVLIFILFFLDREAFKNINDHPLEMSFLKGENLKKLIKKTFCCEIEKLKEKTINGDLLIDSKFKKQLENAKDDEKKLSKIYNDLIEKYYEEAIEEGEKNKDDKVTQALYKENISNQIHFSRMNTSLLNIDKEQRKGGFGGVQKFQLNNTGEEFALKTANQETSDDPKTKSQWIKRIMNIKFLEREIYFLKQLNHPNIIQYKGKRIKDNVPQMVMEFARGGSLDDLLKNKNEKNEILPIKFKLKMIKQLADALNYIHNLNIIHCDIKPLNILLDKIFEDDENPDKYPNVKLIDFGLSCSKDEQVAGYSLLYTAPEILNKKNVNAKPSLDVFSFGSVCYEILIQKRPYYEINFLYIIKNNIRTGKTPDLKAIKIDEKYKEIINIIRDCWKYDPEERPNMETIIEKLNKL